MTDIAISNGTVLIVDDTPGNLALLSDTLSEANYRVLVATDGKSAIEQIQYIKPDIILLDVMMPGIDGFETCNRLKANPATQWIPVLFMTGLSELDNLLRGFGEGALDYIVKPIRPPEVLARIEVHLSQIRNLRRAERLLADAEFAALAVDSSGRITWLTAAAQQWLGQLQIRHGFLCTSQINQPLPEPLNRGFHNWLADRASEQPITELALAKGFSMSVSRCEHPDQFLLLLKSENEGPADLLREKLKLTCREAEILMWIARGKTNKEIGLILSSSPRTVNKHLEHIFEKLGVSTRSAAVALMMQYG